METQTVEYKQTWRDDFLKEICAFANSQGGTLYVGIADNGEVVGVEHPHKLQEDIPNKPHLVEGNYLKRAAALLFHAAPEKFITGKHGSRPHNPDIAATFFRAGEVEAWGQGIERIQTYCADNNCPAPEWRFDGAGIWTVFYNKTNSNSGEKGRDKSGEKTTEKSRGKGRGKGREKSREKILQLIIMDTHITYEELASSLNISIKSIEKHIKKFR